MRQRLGDQVNDVRLRMANVPEGATLFGDRSALCRDSENSQRLHFPGIPKILQSAFTRSKRPFVRNPTFSKMFLSDTAKA